MPKWHDMGSPEPPLPGSQSCPISPLKPLQQDETVVYSALSRPLPEYSLVHLFSQCGPGGCLRRAMGGAAQPASAAAAAWLPG